MFIELIYGSKSRCHEPCNLFISINKNRNFDLSLTWIRQGNWNNFISLELLNMFYTYTYFASSHDTVLILINRFIFVNVTIPTIQKFYSEMFQYYFPNAAPNIFTFNKIFIYSASITHTGKKQLYISSYISMK